MKILEKQPKSMSGHGITGFELTQNILQNLNKYELKPTTKLVLLYLASCYNPKHGKMFPKQKTIALKIGVSEASVIRAISELHKEGLIISERKYINSYRFTSKIVSECPQKLQVKKCQNESLETCNLQPHDIEQIKEQKKEPLKVEDFKILKAYAQKMKAGNINAYINKLISNGSAKEIIKEAKRTLANARAMEQFTKENIKNLEFARANRAENISADFFENIRKKVKK